MNTWRNMISHRQRVLMLLAVSSCLLAASFSLDFIEPRIHSHSDSILVPHGDAADLSTRIRVATLEFQHGEEVEYSFEASGIIRFTVTAYPVDTPYPPLIPVLSITAASCNDRFVAGFDGVYRFTFANPSETSDVEVTYTIVHKLPYPTAIPTMFLTIVAALALSYTIRCLIFHRRWHIGSLSLEQHRINNLRERRRTDSKSLWLRH